MSGILNERLNGAQLRLLALFGQTPDVPEAVWEEIQATVARQLIDRLGEEAGSFTEEQGWTDEDFHRLARTPLKRSA